MDTIKKYKELSEIEKHKIKTHISNLISISKIDGKFSKSEIEAIFKICERYGVNRQELEDIMESNATDYIVPSDSFEKLEQIYDFVSVIIADNNIDPKEIDLCKEIAKTIKLKEENINNLILTIVDDIRRGRKYEDVKMNLYAIVHD